MVKFGKLPSRLPPIDESTSTRYDQMPVVVDGVEIMARPFSFSADVQDGTPVTIIKLSTSCPICGHGIIVETVEGIKPPPANCSNCTPQSKPNEVAVTDPFVNPIDAGLIDVANLVVL